MRKSSNATGARREAGLALAGLGVLSFSLSLPATRVAVEHLDPWLVAFGRAVVAALLGALALRATRSPRPSPAQVRRLLLVALGVVAGFPALTSLALVTQTSSHGAVVVGVLPAVTAVFAVLRAGERPTLAFWGASSLGLLAVLAFAASQGAGGLEVGDLYLLAAVLLCGLGYAEGGALARELGGWRTICWALVLSLPVTVPVAAAAAIVDGVAAPPGAWAGFAYVALVSMFLGFFAWYAGLARAGVARASQLQLAQPVLTLAWSALLLGERVGPATLLAALAVLASVAATQRTRVAQTRHVSDVIAAPGPSLR
jgi:drug/metabolite transporter (DMT)-like permease